MISDESFHNESQADAKQRVWKENLRVYKIGFKITEMKFLTKQRSSEASSKSHLLITLSSECYVGEQVANAVAPSENRQSNQRVGRIWNYSKRLHHAHDFLRNSVNDENRTDETSGSERQVILWRTIVSGCEVNRQCDSEWHQQYNRW